MTDLTGVACALAVWALFFFRTQFIYEIHLLLRRQHAVLEETFFSITTRAPLDNPSTKALFTQVSELS